MHCLASISMINPPVSPVAAAFALVARTLPVFAETQKSARLRVGEFDSSYHPLHSEFTQFVECELVRVLEQEGWTSAEQFQGELQAAVSQEGTAPCAATAELLQLLEEVTNFESWAESMKTAARDWMQLKAPE